MIADLLSLSDRYASLHPGLAGGFKFLRALAADAKEGRHEIDGDRLFGLVQAYRTTPAAERKLEHHRKYADIQYMISGEEVIEFAPLAGLRIETAYDAAKDYGLVGDPSVRSSLVLLPGHFGIFFPDDAHKPGCTSREAMGVRKVVVKVLL